MKFAVRSDCGPCRPTNQDSYLAEGGVFAVADGMGGHQGGETASKMAVHALHNALCGAKPDSNRLSLAVEAANRRIYRLSREDASLAGMGTTLSLLWQDDDRLLIAHVGDSRIYRLRDGKLEQLTEDHSYVGELVRKGELTREAARISPYRNIITRAVGTDASVEADFLCTDLQAGDSYLICSDGLYSMAEDEALETVLNEETDLEKAADRLLQLALEGGGKDNITLILLKEGDEA